MQGWTQKALVGTFMGGLKSEISEGIQMFRPKTLKEVINLARMKNDQLSRQRRLLRYPFNNRTIASLSSNAHAPLPGSAGERRGFVLTTMTNSQQDISVKVHNYCFFRVK